MTVSMSFENDRLYTRKGVRKLSGLSHCNMQFLRWEKAGLLIPVKPNGRSSRTHYWGWHLNDFLGAPSKVA
jgi:hypothetical protein